MLSRDFVAWLTTLSRLLGSIMAAAVWQIYLFLRQFIGGDGSDLRYRLHFRHIHSLQTTLSVTV